ncbi:MAG TPA: NAD(P)-binding domain-containing protein [Mycobacteriales bacterium]
MTNVDVAVLGAGQAGLSSAFYLRKYDVDFVMFDRGEQPGGAWRHRWPSLRLGRTNHVHDLPGLPMPRADQTVPASDVVTDYFGAYEREFDLPVHRPAQVTAVRDVGERLRVETTVGTWDTRAVINATGTWDRPFWPAYPGRETFLGRQLHTADYGTAEEFRGKHVVVVGGGLSGVQLLMEIAEVTTTTWVTRRPPVWREGEFTPEYGRAAVALVEQAVREGRPPASVVSVTGLIVTPEIRAAQARGVLHRRPMFERITPTGVAWADGRRQDADVILWCTGFRPVIDHLAPLKLREPRGGILMDGTRAVRDPRVHLVGYGPSASTIGATRAGRAAAVEIRDLLQATAAA